MALWSIGLTAMALAALGVFGVMAHMYASAHGNRYPGRARRRRSPIGTWSSVRTAAFADGYRRRDGRVTGSASQQYAKRCQRMT